MQAGNVSIPQLFCPQLEVGIVWHLIRNGLPRYADGPDATLDPRYVGPDPKNPVSERDLVAKLARAVGCQMPVLEG